MCNLFPPFWIIKIISTLVLLVILLIYIQLIVCVCCSVPLKNYFSSIPAGNQLIKLSKKIKACCAKSKFKFTVKTKTVVVDKLHVPLCPSHAFRIFTDVLDRTIPDWNMSKVWSKSCDSWLKIQTFIKICKNIYLITTTIRHCSGGVPI
jgi:hypothetical protein